MPQLQLPPETVDMPQLVDLINGRAKGRTNDKQSLFFLNVGAIGAQFEGVAATPFIIVHVNAGWRYLGLVLAEYPGLTKVLAVRDHSSQLDAG